MREFVRPVAAALCLASLAAAMTIVSTSGALAQGKPMQQMAQAAPPPDAPVKQIALIATACLPDPALGDEEQSSIPATSFT